MPETTTDIQPDSTTSTTIDTTPDFNTIGYELEYPVGDHSYQAGPSLYARESPGLRGEGWLLNIDGVPDTQSAGRDHVGAEIRSPVFDLHTTQPEAWFEGSINHGEDLGYPFAARGYGDTVFGLHMHLSQLDESQVEFIDELCREPWMIGFVCASVSEESAVPWRFGGVGSQSLDPSRSIASRTSIREVHSGKHAERHETGRFEWRLPEPMMPEHFGMVMHFLRLVSLREFDEAREYAQSAVEEKDDRLTFVQQWRQLENENPGWPDEKALHATEGDNDFYNGLAEYYAELMEE